MRAHTSNTAFLESSDSLFSYHFDLIFLFEYHDINEGRLTIKTPDSLSSERKNSGGLQKSREQFCPSPTEDQSSKRSTCGSLTPFLRETASFYRLVCVQSVFSKTSQTRLKIHRGTNQASKIVLSSLCWLKLHYYEYLPFPVQRYLDRRFSADLDLL